MYRNSVHLQEHTSAIQIELLCIFGGRQNIMRFLDKKTNEIKEAYSIRKNGNNVLVKFQKGEKEYSYNQYRIQILKDTASFHSCRKVYKFNKRCGNCGKTTSIYTYIVFSDDPKEDVTFPWDKKRLRRNQNTFAHLCNPSLEFYGFRIIGQDEDLDEQFAKAFPQKIKIRYYPTRKMVYFEAQNLCDHCRAFQDKFSIYKCVDIMIQQKKKIDWIEINFDS